MSFLHVVRPDIDLPASDKEGIYAKGAENLAAFQSKSWLQRDAKPAMYLYRLDMTLLGNPVSQIGLVCCCHADDYTSGVIKKHEKTRQEKEDERTRMVLDLNANAEPVFFLFKDTPAINDRIKQDTQGAPENDFTAPDGVRHRIWAAPDPAFYESAFAAVPCAYVADGHHRTASAANAGAKRSKANPNHTGNEEYNWFLTVLFPDSELSILPYHRTVADLNGHTPQAFLDKLSEIGDLSETTEAQPQAPGSIGLYLGEALGWRTLTFPKDSIDHADPIASLDYVLLTERILDPLLGIKDIRTDKRIDFVGGIRGTGELEQRINSGRATVAFAMHPTTINQLISVADADQIMPPKSTWFEPKLRSGLFVHTLD
jgi:uncharacterized protein (DUF1015 family)